MSTPAAALAPPPSPTATPTSTTGSAPSRPMEVGPYNAYINAAAGLTRKKSTDDVGVTGYDVYAWINGAFTPVTTQFSTSGDWVVGVVLQNLTPGRDYLFYVVAKDADGNLSAPSDLVRQRAMVEPPIPASPGPGAPDTTPPGTPAGMAAVTGMDIPGGIFLAWNTVSDDSGVPPKYDLFRRTDHGYAYEGENGTPRDIVTGLEGGKPYTFQVVARDAAGNLSAASAPYTAVAQSDTPPVSCAVTYTQSAWKGGLTASVKITNTGTTAIDGWKLTFLLPTQHLTKGWSARWTQSDSVVTAENYDWNKTIKPGRSVSIGFNATFPGNQNTPPMSFTLNQRSCTIT
ncbi:cellulose binding domain-containing protein [Microbispora amethystogenes]|nr:cellulose binding domain-containing protein [Microbispora amethystogenes]